MINLNIFVPCNQNGCDHGYLFNDEGVQQCNCLIQYYNKMNCLIQFHKSGLNDQILNYDIAKYVGKDQNENIIKIKEYINRFQDKFKNIHLYLYGLNGTQKTTLASYIGREIIKKNYIVYFVYMDTLVNNLSETRPTEEIIDNNKKWLESDLLIIDDSFDRNKVKPYSTGFQISYLDSFLRKRLEQLSKATIFTSNISIKMINDIWGISIQELIKRNSIEMEFLDTVDQTLINRYKGSIWKSR